MRNDELAKRKSHLIVFAFAVMSPVLRKITLGYEIREQHGVGAVSETEEIEEALRWRGMNVGEGG